MQHTTPHQTSQGTQNPNTTAVTASSIGYNKDYEIYEGKKLIRKRKLKILLIISDETFCPHSIRFTKEERKELRERDMSIGF